jgi:two-component system, chemotaxis family, sensor kinase CheA
MSDTFRDTFIVEAHELLAELDAGLLELEEAPEDKNTVGRVFRALHTIKGSGAMVGWDEIATFTHEVENVFELVRLEKLAVSKNLVDLTLAAGDVIRCMLEASDTAETKEQAEGIIRGLEKVVTLDALSGGKTRDDSGPPVPRSPQDQALSSPAASEGYVTYRIFFRPHPDIFGKGINPILLLNDLTTLGDCKILAHLDAIPVLEDLNPEECHTYWDVILTTRADINAIRDVFIFVEDECELKIEVSDEHGNFEDEVQYKKIGEVLVDRGDISQEQLNDVLDKQKRIGEMLVEAGLVNKSNVEAALVEQQHLQELREKTQKGQTAATVRVPAAKLDSLVDLVGELVTVQASLTQLASTGKVPELRSIAEHVDRLTAELRDNTMSLRMLPIGTTFNKFNRLVRDLAGELAKEVVLATKGAETELDKTVIERLNDPLVHLIRNSIDHGIEPPDVREAAGKPRQGVVHLSAIHSGAHVLIRITDDGAGLDEAAIRKKAVANGLIGPEAELSEREIFALIFAPGFSTAEKITNVSGRGVGMDVVKRSIESLRGSIEISSQKGVGTTITLKLPLTLAIIDGLLIKIGDAHFVLPLSVVEECVELTREDVAKAHDRHMTFIRGKIVPYIRLRERFSINGGVPPIEQIVVTETMGGKVGLVVDKVIGEHQTVIKNLGKVYRNVDGISGATILGDGTVALIVDVPKIIQEVELAEIAAS